MAARGIQGDTLTMVGFGLAAVLIWNKVSSAADKLGKKLEFGQNSGGPLQAETTDEINQYEAEVSSWFVDWSSLPHKKIYYKGIANKIFSHVNSHMGYLSNINEDYLLGLCKPLSANELRAVAVSFGVKDINNAFGLTTWSGHIFHLFDQILSDSFLGGNDLSSMKAIWAKAGIWL